METVAIQIKKNAYTRVNAGVGSIILEAKEDEFYVIVSELEPEKSAEAFHRVEKFKRLRLADVGTNTWVMGTTQDQEVIVTEEANLLEVASDGGSGRAVFVQDQTTGVLGIPFLAQLAVLSLAADTVVNSRFITLTPGHGLASPGNDGDIIELADPTSGSNFMQSEIINIVGDVVELDSLVNRIYLSTGAAPELQALVAASTSDMRVDGSVTPVIFSVLPFDLQSGDMVRVIPEINGTAPMDFETFGDIAALDIGCQLRVNNGDGTYRNLYSFKRNADIIVQCFDHDFFTNIGNNARALVARLTWGGQSKHGVVIRLRGSELQALEMVIHDDLSVATNPTLTKLRWIAQGSEIQS